MKKKNSETQKHPGPYITRSREKSHCKAGNRNRLDHQAVMLPLSQAAGHMVFISLNLNVFLLHGHAV